ncbi:unnamed protein product [Rhizophagus irregularis]|uniref:NYN domain-containing protein n=1 Tax=Rhizophagus irregularis TaxID=588596 RepID=A0A2I1HJH8_9GLOM|nr:hypothetical protein RhiirA4_514196 [Rhizophagus irregularis]CAB4404350.1 unnamed protein product [Rhizophagus irregularis]
MSELSDLIPANRFETFDIGYVRKFLKLNNYRFFLSEDEIRKFSENFVNGKVFLAYTKEKLVQDGIRRGPADHIAEYIARVNNQRQPVATTAVARSPKPPNDSVSILQPVATTAVARFPKPPNDSVSILQPVATTAVARSPKPPNDSVSIFIDNSNLFIEGSKVIGYLERVNVSDHRIDVYIDHGLIVKTILKGRNLNRVFIVGSVPPVNDSLWARAKEHGYGVETYLRNASNKEKKVDGTLITELARSVFRGSPSTISLVAGDGDYCYIIRVAREENWKAETWFWHGFPDRGDYPFTTPMSKELKNLSLYNPLENYYKKFTYITGPDLTNKKHILEISGSIIKNWRYRNEKLMECFCTLELFGRWHWVDDEGAHLYFKNKGQLENAKTLFEQKYKGLWVAEVV